MSKSLSLELRVARKKAGLLQQDVAHLLHISQPMVSDLEAGRITPTVQQTVTLSVIYGRSFEGFFSEAMEEAKHGLRERLNTLPQNTRSTYGTLNRASSLDRLRERVAVDHHGV